jgi:hypothetical protein
MSNTHVLLKKKGKTYIQKGGLDRYPKKEKGEKKIKKTDNS